MEGDEPNELAAAIEGVSPEPEPEPSSGSPSNQPDSELTKPPEGEPASPGDGEPADKKPPPGDGGEPPEPLTISEATKVEDLLKTPLGPVLQQWADKAASAQVKAAVEQERANAQQTSDAAEMQRLDSYFSQFSEEELGEVLAQSKEVSAKYAEVQRWKEGQVQAGSTEQVAAAAQVYSYVHAIRTYNSLLEASDLPQEKRDELKPEKYTHLGAAGINEWGKAVYSALVQHEVQKAVDKELETRWEAYKQEHLAELGLDEGEAPPGGGPPGSPTPAKLPLMETSSELLLEAALEGKQRRGGT